MQMVLALVVMIRKRKNKMQGQIIEIVSDLHIVSCDGVKYRCKCRGKFRNKHIIPLVGDFCIFDDKKLIIEEILPRKYCFESPKVSNIDQGIIVTSLNNPDFSINLLDRFLTIMELNKVTTIICITKEDLISCSQLNEINHVLDYYRNIGYLVVSNTEIEKIKGILKNKTSVFTGQTGAGKSTLLNKIDKDLGLLVGDVSEALGRGKHTTRVVSLFEVCGGKVLDTPGFSAVEFSKYSIEDIKNSFIEFKNFSCLYKDCSHTNESVNECSVKKAVLERNILEERYNDYLKFIERR